MILSFYTKLKFRKPIVTPNGIPNLFGIKKSCAAKQYRMTLSFCTKLKFRIPILPPNGLSNLFGIKKDLRSKAI
ncbi:MAG: flagellum-specific peptidoglycan hydrolase FlgJ [Halioglobus sp.]|jgi:flagellum-specific peptidoglycan hydrolase FlgJ